LDNSSASPQSERIGQRTLQIMFFDDKVRPARVGTKWVIG
jgi:hypothetical protein